MKIGDLVDGTWVVEALLGEGQFGTVWKAVDLRCGKVVAVKELKPDWVSSKKVVKRFRNEYKVLKKLRHENVLHVINLFQVKDTYMIIMEYLNGGSLADRLGRVPWVQIDTTLSIVAKLLNVLEITNKLKIVHRDIKPSNILFADWSSEHPKLTDFGLAHLPDELLSSSRPTTHPQAIGTLAYMSPEQLNGEELDIRSDLYSLGMTLYKMLTGRLFFDEQLLGPIDIQSAICRPFRERPSRYRLDLPEWLDELVTSMISFELFKRPESPQAVLEIIQRNIENL